MSGRTAQLDAVRERLRSVRLRAVPETPAWEREPAPTVARPGVTVALAASQRLRAGLADQWRTRPIDRHLTTVAGADLFLLELADRQVPGFGPADDPVLLQTVAAARAASVPVVVWITGGRPPSHRVARAAVTALLAQADQVYAADLVATWRRFAPEVRPLAPAASARRAPERTERGGVLVVSPGASDESAAGAVSVIVAPALRPLADVVEVRTLDPDLPPRGVLPESLAEAARPASPAEVPDLAGRAGVLVDAPRRTPGDTWTLLAAAAAGTPVVSVVGLEAPAGVPVVAPGEASALRAEVVARVHQRELADREALRQRRAVLAAHTFGHRARFLLGEAEPPKPTVSAIVPTNRPHELETVLANAGRQSHPTELVLVLHGFEAPSDLEARAREHGVEHLVVRTAPRSLTLGACLNLGIEAAAGDLIAKMDDDNHYGVHYLADLSDALRAQGAGIAGKWAHHVWLRSSGAVVLRYPEAENRWVRRIQGGSMLFEGELARSLRFGDLPRAVDSDVLDRALADGVPIWSADRFNFVSVRGEDRSAHTWTVEDATFLTAAGRLAFYGDPRSHVEV